MDPDEANLGGYVGFIFGGLAFVGTIWAYVFIPETKGRTVDECVSLFLVFAFSLRNPCVARARFVVRETGACEAVRAVSVV